MISSSQAIINCRSSRVPTDQPSFRLYRRMIQHSVSPFLIHSQRSCPWVLPRQPASRKLSLWHDLPVQMSGAYLLSLYVTLRSKHPFKNSSDKEPLSLNCPDNLEPCNMPLSSLLKCWGWKIIQIVWFNKGNTNPHSHTNDNNRYLVSISYVLNIMLKYFYMNDLNPYNCFSQGRLGYAAVTNNPQISVIYNDRAYFSLFYMSTVEWVWEALFHMVLTLGSET